MRLRDAALAALTSVIWGFAYVTYRFGLESFSPAQLTAMRFLIACLPVFFVPRPKLAWPMIVLIGLILVKLTGIEALDSIVAIVVAAAIVAAGVRILIRSGQVLMDSSPPDEELDRIEAAIESARPAAWALPSLARFDVAHFAP